MKFQSSLKILPMIFITLVTFVLGSCGDSATLEPATETKTPVRFQMGWIHEYSFAGFHAAERNGRFEAQGLEVSFIEGGFNEQGYIDPVSEVLAGNAEFGLSDTPNLLTARAEGKPVVAIAAVLQHSPSVVISQAEDNLVRPSDLRGKRVAVADGGAVAIFNSMLASQNIDPADVSRVSRTDFGIDPLINGEVDALFGWIINEGVLIQEAQLEPNFILPSDYGIDTYDFLIFTTEQTIAEQPQLVERFVSAFIQGHQDIIDNPEQAIDYVLLYNDSLVREEQQRRLQAMLPLLKPAGSSIGEMKPEIWELSHQILLDYGILSQPVDVQAAYTQEFIEKVYAASASR